MSSRPTAAPGLPRSPAPPWRSPKPSAFARENKTAARIAQPLVDTIAAVSVGIIDGIPMLDLPYIEDVRAETDMNVVVTGSGKFVEVQGTAEGAPFDRDGAQQAAGPCAAGDRAARGHPARNPGRSPVSTAGADACPAWCWPRTTRGSCGSCASCCGGRFPGSTSTRRWWTRRRPVPPTSPRPA